MSIESGNVSALAPNLIVVTMHDMGTHRSDSSKDTLSAGSRLLLKLVCMIGTIKFKSFSDVTEALHAQSQKRE